MVITSLVPSFEAQPLGAAATLDVLAASPVQIEMRKWTAMARVAFGQRLKGKSRLVKTDVLSSVLFRVVHSNSQHQ